MIKQTSKQVKNSNLNEWFKFKRYQHIGLPITPQDKQYFISYIKNPKNIEKHSFFPFIHERIISEKYRK